MSNPQPALVKYQTWQWTFFPLCKTNLLCEGLVLRCGGCESIVLLYHLQHVDRGVGLYHLRTLVGRHLVQVLSLINANIIIL